MNEKILQVKDIHKSYKVGESSLHVLKGLSVDIQQGEFVTMVGASGSGKSTLLHLLGALDESDSGEIFFEEFSLNSFSRRRLDKYRNSEVGFVFQFYHLINELTVLENILMPAMAYCSSLRWLRVRKQYHKRAHILLEELGLLDRMKHKPYQLSGGERQRVALGRALINQPRLLLADEPTGNLDWKTGQEILSIFDRLHKQGQTIVMVTHDERIAQRADRCIKIEDGVIIECIKN